jgi:hypothetical protein
MLSLSAIRLVIVGCYSALTWLSHIERALQLSIYGTEKMVIAESN